MSSTKVSAFQVFNPRRYAVLASFVKVEKLRRRWVRLQARGPAAPLQSQVGHSPHHLRCLGPTVPSREKANSQALFQPLLEGPAEARAGKGGRPRAPGEAGPAAGGAF